MKTVYKPAVMLPIARCDAAYKSAAKMLNACMKLPFGIRLKSLVPQGFYHSNVC